MGRRRQPLPEGMVTLPGGAFPMGSDDFYPEERPAHWRRVDPFESDRTPVTNDAFAAFVADTGYVTVAERELDPAEYPELDDDAFATWAGLPTEAEAVYAASGGPRPDPKAWGLERGPGGATVANTWRGRFPYLNTAEDGWARTSPVDRFSANVFGLYETKGNVWEWTSDYYAPDHSHASAVPHAPARAAGSVDACRAPTVDERATRSAEDSATDHIGFRCARSLA